MFISADDKWMWPPSEQGVNARSGWQETHWWGLWGPKRLDEWATAYELEFKVPVKARAWATVLRALQALGWAALAECKKVWKVFCKLRAGKSAEVAATAKQVAARARQQRWRETEQLRAGTRALKRAKAAADKERARRLREELDPTRPDRPKRLVSEGAWPGGAAVGGQARLYQETTQLRPPSRSGGEGFECGPCSPHALAEEAQTSEGAASRFCAVTADVSWWSRCIQAGRERRGGGGAVPLTSAEVGRMAPLSRQMPGLTSCDGGGGR
jgi:hypothetical protein